MENCIFCQIVAGSAPSWRVHETKDTYAFLDINPVSPYHTLVIPKKHYINMFDVPEENLLAVMKALRDVVNLYQEKLGLTNLQVLSSSGAEAQQDVFHLHYHIVPRRRGDGQNIKWQTYPEMRKTYDEMIDRLRN